MAALSVVVRAGSHVKADEPTKGRNCTRLPLNLRAENSLRAHAEKRTWLLGDLRLFRHADAVALRHL
jgi:hypothetical protein